jgi:hypothetical protein
MASTTQLVGFTGAYGGGGTGADSGTASLANNGTAGAIRVIWGTDRSFPFFAGN